MKHFKRFSSIVFLSFLFLGNLFGESFFSGYAGGKLNYSSDTTSDSYNPDLKMQAFFQGQFNFSDNVWSHMELSINTGDFISEDFFHSTVSDFNIDELSVITKARIENTTNYFSAFMGTYDSIGSDIFFRRYFGIKSISSKITESWLGIAGSILYPHFGLGISDVIKMNINPIALGFYVYFNHEDDKYFVFNSDLRFACAYRYFSFDFAGGIGTPLSDKYKDEDVWFAVDKLYWHAGTTMLVGNNYTQSLYIQAGLYNAPFTKTSKKITTTQEDVYLLFEPRFLLDSAHINISLYSFPKDTVKKLMFVNDTLGVNVNIYSDSLTLGSKVVTLGTHFSYSFPDKYFLDLKNIKDVISGEFNITMTPYISSPFLSGELHSQLTVNFMEIKRTQWYNAFSFDLGYRTSL